MPVLQKATASEGGRYKGNCTGLKTRRYSGKQPALLQEFYQVGLGVFFLGAVG
jgi:hypothetical protein